MTAQFIVAFIIFMSAVIFTAGLWLKALRKAQFRKIANFYRIVFLGLCVCLAGTVWAQALAAINSGFGDALFQGLSATFIVFVLFAWGRLTALGLKFDATHQLLSE